MYMLPCVPQESSQNSSDIMPALMELSDNEEAEAVGRPQRVCKLQVATMDVVLVSCFLRVCKSQALPATMQQVLVSCSFAFCNLKGKFSAGRRLIES